MPSQALALALALWIPAAAASEGEDEAPSSSELSSPKLPPPPPDGFGDVDGFGRFEFGSYGRVNASWDLRGGMAKPLHVVGFFPRLGKAPYVEFDLGYRKHAPSKRGPVTIRAVITLALLPPFFHFTGDLDSRLAVRNLYMEASDLFGGHLDFWVGSRMYRGDDVYLLDFWPLDDLNTWGGGTRVRFGGLSAALHVGVNRLTDDFQYQQIEVPRDDRPGSRTVVTLDRQRTVASAQVEYQFIQPDRDLGAKVKLYSELHLLPEGTYRKGFDDEELLPADRGFLLGAQLGLWGFGEHAFANLFVRYASGLAAYDELGIPFGLDQEKRAASAKQFQVALSAGYEIGPIGVLLGAALRNFKDADSNRYDRDDGWEIAVSVRPTVFVTRFYHQAFELSYEHRRPNGNEPESQQHLQPSVFRASVMPSLSFAKGSLARPQLQLVYTLAVPSKGVLLDLPLGDPRRADCDPTGACASPPQHYLGIGAEWWWGNSSY